MSKKQKLWVQVFRVTKKGNLRMRWEKRKVRKKVRYE